MSAGRCLLVWCFLIGASGALAEMTNALPEHRHVGATVMFLVWSLALVFTALWREGTQ